MANNLTAYNVKFHSDYKKGLVEGIRVPIDNRLATSTKDRPFALGSFDTAWAKGSVNRAVKEMNDFYGGAVNVNDLADYNAGKMDIVKLNRYVKKNFLYGVFADTKNKIVTDMMGFRGYPTFDIKLIKLLKVELNQDTALTKNTGNEPITAESFNFSNQVQLPFGSTLPIASGSDYLVMSGYVELQEAVPFDSINVSIREEIELVSTMTVERFSDINKGALNVYSNTKCMNDGSNTKFYFRISGESNSVIFDTGDKSPQVWTLRLSNNDISAVDGDAFYGVNVLSNDNETPLPITWNGTKWVGSADIILDIIAPTVPTNLHFISLVGDTLSFGWTASTDNIGVKIYHVSVDNLDGGVTPPSGYDISTLVGTAIVQGNTNYRINVSAEDYAGNISPVATLLYTTVALALQQFFINTSTTSGSITTCALGSTYAPMYTANVDDILLNAKSGQIYNDSAGTSPMNGNNNWWKCSKLSGTAPYYALRVSSSGSIWGYQAC